MLPAGINALKVQYLGSDGHGEGLSGYLGCSRSVSRVPPCRLDGPYGDAARA